jgi:YD repeat-containing protein
VKQVTDPASGVTVITYDANDHVATVTDPQTLQTGYTYNGFGQRKQLVSPATGTTTTTFDSGGNIYQITDARNAVVELPHQTGQAAGW